MVTDDKEIGLAAIGARLQEAREAAGLTVEQVALRMRLSSAQITALEAGRAADLPPGPYVRGYVRGYAQLLGIPQEEVGVPMTVPPVIPPVAQEPVAVQPSGRSGIVRAIVVVTAIMVVFVVLWWHGGGKPHPVQKVSGHQAIVKPLQAHAGLPPRLQSLAVPGKTAGQLSRFPLGGKVKKGGRKSRSLGAGKVKKSGLAHTQRAPVKAVPAKAPPHVTAEIPAAATTATTSKVATHATAKGAKATTSATTKTVAVSATQAGAVPGQGGLVSLPHGPQATLQVAATKSDCWLAVYGASGRQLAYQLLRRGQKVQMAGTPPFRVSFGNPVGIHVVLNGHAVRLPKGARSGQVLHIQVGSQLVGSQSG